MTRTDARQGHADTPKAQDDVSNAPDPNVPVREVWLTGKDVQTGRQMLPNIERGTFVAGKVSVEAVVKGIQQHGFPGTLREPVGYIDNLGRLVTLEPKLPAPHMQMIGVEQHQFAAAPPAPSFATDKWARNVDAKLDAMASALQKIAAHLDAPVRKPVGMPSAASSSPGIAGLADIVSETPEVSREAWAQSEILNFGARVRAKRESQEMTLEALAARAGTTAAQISNIERGLGKLGPSLDLAARISWAVGLPPMFAGDESANPAS